MSVESTVFTDINDVEYSIFIVKNGRVLTPPSDKILPRIAHAQILNFKGELPTNESKVFLQQMREAEEAFLTNSLMGVMPVASVDDHFVTVGVKCSHSGRG